MDTSSAIDAGFHLFRRKRLAALAPGEAEPDFEDEWDDLTLSERRPYVEEAMIAAGSVAVSSPTQQPKPTSAPGSAAPAQAGSPTISASAEPPQPGGTAIHLIARPPQPGSPPAVTSSKPVSDMPVVRIATAPMVDLPSEAGRSTKRPAPEPRHTEANRAHKSPSATKKPKRPKTAYELWKRVQPAPSDGEDDESPNLEELSDKAITSVLKLLQCDTDGCSGRSALLARARETIERVGAPKWRRAGHELDLREMWKAMDDTQKRPFEQEAAAAKEAYETTKQFAKPNAVSDGGTSSHEAGDGGPHNSKWQPTKKRQSSNSDSSATPLPAKQRLKLAASAAFRDASDGDASDLGGAVHGRGRARGGRGRGRGRARSMKEVSEEPCPEFGDGWIRQSRERIASAEGKHVDHYYFSPSGEMFNSRIKVLRHLGLATDPNPQSSGRGAGRPHLTEEERRARKSEAQLARQAARDKKREEREKKAEARARAKAARRDRSAQRKERVAAAVRDSAAAADAALSMGDAPEEVAPICERPEPPGQLQLIDGSVASDVMGAWAFASAFSNRLTLSRFSVDDFVAALRRPGHGTVLAELHIRLLKALLHDTEHLRRHGGQLPPPLDIHLVLQQLPPPSVVTGANWPEVLRSVSWLLPELHETESSREALGALMETDYPELSVVHKLALLRTLIERCLSVEVIRQELSDNESRRKDLSRELKETQASLRRDHLAAVSRLAQTLKRSSSKQVQPPPKPTGLQRELMSLGLAAAPPATLEPPKEVVWVAAPPDDEVSDDTEGGEEDDDDSEGEATTTTAARGGVATAEKAAAREAAMARRAAREVRRERLKAKERCEEELLEAIRSRDAGALAAAIEAAEQAGHMGEHADGRPWMTEALKAARKVENSVLVGQKSGALTAKLTKQLAQALNKYHEKMAMAPVREEPIGVDARGRAYYFFFADPHRLWVHAPPGCLDPPPWQWAFYDTAAQVREVLGSLDGTAAVSIGSTHLPAPHLSARGSLASEADFKRRLRELLPIISADMAVDEITNQDEGWMDHGHTFVGCKVLRIFPEVGPSIGKITRWLPADESSGDGALFHVVHDADGDQEDLEEVEAEQAVSNYREHEANRLAEVLVLEQPKYSNMREKKAMRLTPAHLGIEGCKNELLEVEEFLAPLLRKVGAGWEPEGRGAEGPRDAWLISCRSADTIKELAELLLNLEEAVHSLQSTDEKTERKPWRKDGHEFIGKPTRRFFEGYGASDGRITGWLPADADDPPLWHMIHGNHEDEEDLDEREALFAIQNYEKDRCAPTQEELDYLAEWQARADADASVDAAAESAVHAEGPPDYTETERGLSRASSPMPLMHPTAARPSRHRLWQSREARERFRSALRHAHCAALVSLAARSFRQHCAAFGILGWRPPRGKGEEDTQLALSAWVHADAFKGEKGKTSKKK